MLYDSDPTYRSKTKIRPEVPHKKAAINISYTGKCWTLSGHLTKRCHRKGVEQLFLQSVLKG